MARIGKQYLDEMIDWNCVQYVCSLSDFDHILKYFYKNFFWLMRFYLFFCNMDERQFIAGSVIIIINVVQLYNIFVWNFCLEPLLYF